MEYINKKTINSNKIKKHIIYEESPQKKLQFSYSKNNLSCLQKKYIFPLLHQ